MKKFVIGIFDHHKQAMAARDDLISAGFAGGNITLADTRGVQIQSESWWQKIRQALGKDEASDNPDDLAAVLIVRSEPANVAKVRMIFDEHKVHHRYEQDESPDEAQAWSDDAEIAPSSSPGADIAAAHAVEPPSERSGSISPYAEPEAKDEPEDIVPSGQGSYKITTQRAAYDFGRQLAVDPRFAGLSFDEAEPLIRAEFHHRRIGSWDDHSDIVKQAYEQARAA